MIKQQLLKYSVLTKDFGICVAFNELSLRLIGKLFGRNTNLWKKLSAHKYRYINNKLKIEFCDVIEKYLNQEQIGKIDDTGIIWVFWAQGMDAAPSIVKLCVESIKKNSNSHPVICVDNNNLSKYVDLDKNILEKYKEGSMSTPHFSDVVRFKLLSEYGGIWCDSTIFLSKSIDCVQLNKYSFFTVRHGIGQDYLACRGLWSTFFVASSKGNVLSSFVYECLCKYWNQHESAIDYLFLDCIISIGYKYIESITSMIDAIPENSTNVFDAMQMFENLEEERKIKEKLDVSAVNKLTYKTVRGIEQVALMKKVLLSYNKLNECK